MLEAKAFKDFTEDERKEFLEKRTQQSSERYKRLKEQAKKEHKAKKKFKAFVHGGNRAIDALEKKAKDEEGLAPYVWVFNPTTDRDWICCVLVVPQETTNENITCTVTYALKSPVDVYKPHVGRGLCGTRLEGETPWRFEVSIPKRIYRKKKENVQKSVSNLISTKVLLGERHIPQRLLKKFC